jgi:hypothetical protein
LQASGLASATTRRYVRANLADRVYKVLVRLLLRRAVRRSLSILGRLPQRNGAIARRADKPTPMSLTDGFYIALV